MDKKISYIGLKEILHEMTSEVDERNMLYFAVRDGELNLYTTMPGIWIGKGGERIVRYERKFKDIGIKKVNLIEVENGRRVSYSEWTAEDWDTL